MKHFFSVILIALLFLVGMANASPTNHLSATPNTLTFTNVTVSPSASKSYVLANSGSSFVIVTITPMNHTEISLDNATFQSLPLTKDTILAYASQTVYVRVVASTPIDTAGTITNIGGNVNTAPVSVIIDAPLPIELSSFKISVLPKRNGVELNWITATETNNYGFYVQKSLNGKTNFVNLNSIVINGHGTTLSQHQYSYTDMTSPFTYYRLKQVDLDGTVSYSTVISLTLADVVLLNGPTTFALSQNYPNPFNPSTKIQFSLDKVSHVTLTVYNVLGERVATLVDETLSVGEHVCNWNPNALASGIYVYSLQSDSRTIVKRMIFMK